MIYRRPARGLCRGQRDLGYYCFRIEILVLLAATTPNHLGSSIMAGLRLLNVPPAGCDLGGRGQASRHD